MVAVVAQAVSARVLLVVMVPSTGIVGTTSLPLVRSYRGNGVVGVQEPDVVETDVEVLRVEEPSGF
jgi:hypothetical protein